MDLEELLQKNWAEITKILQPFCLTPSVYSKIEKLFMESARLKFREQQQKDLISLYKRAQRNQDDLNGKMLKMVYLKSFIEDILKRNKYE